MRRLKLSSPTDSYQQYICPEEFDDRLREVGGINRYGENNFLIRWAQGGQKECLYRAGGNWHVENQPSYSGYRDLLLGGGSPSWMLLMWEDPVTYGTAESYYVGNYDDESDLQTLGEYPYAGRYRMLYNMVWRDFSSGKLKLEPMPLNTYVVDNVIPIIMEARYISWEKTRAALKGIKEKEDAAEMNKIEEAMRSASVAFKGPVSYARQGCRTHFLDKKVEAMTRNWNKMVTNARMLGRGLSAHTSNPTV
jgi:hypothetical protein